MRKTIFGIAISAALLALFTAVLPSYAKNAQAPSGDLPEQAGVYNVPGHPGLKLRVFVYGPKVHEPAKPSRPTPTPPSVACAPSAVADQDSLETIPGAGWHLPASWTYRLNLSSVPASVGSANLDAIATNAFAAWQQSLSAPPLITRGEDTRIAKALFDGQNIVAWGRASSSALAVSYIWYDSTGVAKEIDTIMNNRFSWYWSDPASWPAGEVCAYNGVYDAQNILTHELGHTMGLDDVYEAVYAQNTMYGYGATSETKKDTLTTGDAAGVTALY